MGKQFINISFCSRSNIHLILPNILLSIADILTLCNPAIQIQNSPLSPLIAKHNQQQLPFSPSNK